jgi:hypothetical protein
MFEEYLGRNQHLIVSDPLTSKGIELWLERVLGYYGEDGGADVQIIDGQLILCDKTVKYIYNSFTPLELKYVRGSRPMLEKLLDKLLEPGMSDREKALAIMRQGRDNRDNGLKGKVNFDGGTEEELVKRGAMMCNELARLFCVLCQMSGLPARFVGHHISGHATEEVYVEGKGWWMDSQKGMYCLHEDGSPVSAWELMQDPAIFERQTLEVWSDLRPLGPFSDDGNDPVQRAFNMAKARDCYFNPREAVCVGNYYVWETDRYTYPWFCEAVDPGRRERGVRGEYLNRKALGWPDYYYNHLVFEEPFKYHA